MNSGECKRIAVIGSGISGLSAAWLLSGSHSVTLYEREARLGGHSNTVYVDTPEGAIPVDTGFIVFNEWTYPNLIALFSHLGIETLASEMSFAVSAENGGFEYSGGSLAGLVGQPRNIVRPRFWRMMRDLHRFYTLAPAQLAAGELDDISLGNMLDEGGYSLGFQSDHLLPMAAAIWSGTVDGMRDYPAAAFTRFFINHGLFKYVGRPVWRTVVGGSKVYVDRISEGVETRIGIGVRSIKRHEGRVTVIDQKGHEDTFDHVVMASHADQTLSMLSDADDLERQVLGPFKYQQNLAVLHSDPALMPTRKRLWSSWNYMTKQGTPTSDDASVCVTYWMNLLQSLKTSTDLLVTLNPIEPPKQEHIFQTFQYQHPLFDEHTDGAQRRLWSLQGHRNTFYCGSYFGAGFHEDGLQSGLAAAEAVGGVRRPWNVENESSRIHVVAEAERAA